jgi:hypothetical protein
MRQCEAVLPYQGVIRNALSLFVRVFFSSVSVDNMS